MWLAPLRSELRVYPIAEGIAEDVEGDDGYGDSQPRKDADGKGDNRRGHPHKSDTRLP